LFGPASSKDMEWDRQVLQTKHEVHHISTTRRLDIRSTKDRNYRFVDVSIVTSRCCVEPEKQSLLRRNPILQQKQLQEWCRLVSILILRRKGFAIIAHSRESVTRAIMF